MTIGIFGLVSMAILIGIFLGISDDAKFENDLLNGTAKIVTTESKFSYIFSLFF